MHYQSSLASHQLPHTVASLSKHHSRGVSWCKTRRHVVRFCPRTAEYFLFRRTVAMVRPISFTLGEQFLRADLILYVMGEPFILHRNLCVKLRLHDGHGRALPVETWSHIELRLERDKENGSLAWFSGRTEWFGRITIWRILLSLQWECDMYSSTEVC